MAAKKVRNPHKTRNPDLIWGVGKYSRSKMYHKRGLWAIKAKNGGVFPRHDANEVLPRRRRQKAARQQAQAQAHQAQSKYYSWDGVDYPRREVQGQKSSLFEAALLWASCRRWTIQNQWGSFEACKPILCDWYFPPRLAFWALM